MDRLAVETFEPFCDKILKACQRIVIPRSNYMLKCRLLVKNYVTNVSDLFFVFNHAQEAGEEDEF